MKHLTDQAKIAYRSKDGRKKKTYDALEWLPAMGSHGPEFTAKAVRKWLKRLEVTTLFTEAWSPWENGYNESFNGKLGDELLNREIFTSLREAKLLVERWRREYNQLRPHSSLGYRPPVPEAAEPPFMSQHKQGSLQAVSDWRGRRKMCMVKSCSSHFPPTGRRGMRRIPDVPEPR
jgi:hypothetical protein